MATTAKVAALPTCNFDCDRPADYDFRTAGGSWAYACPTHWERFRMYTDLGTGKGQKLVLDTAD